MPRREGAGAEAPRASARIHVALLISAWGKTKKEGGGGVMFLAHVLLKLMNANANESCKFGEVQA